MYTKIGGIMLKIDYSKYDVNLNTANKLIIDGISNKNVNDIYSMFMQKIRVSTRSLEVIKLIIGIEFVPIDKYGIILDKMTTNGYYRSFDQDLGEVLENDRLLSGEDMVCVLTVV